MTEFEDQADLEQVLLGEPWSYDKYFIAFHQFMDEVAMEDLSFNFVDFWVQIHNLSILSMKKNVIESLGSGIGEVLKVSELEDETGNGQCMRVRVRLDISKPLCRGRKLGQVKGVEGWVSFEYERMPNFCYRCGIPNHGDGDCEDWLRTPPTQRESFQSIGLGSEQ